MGTRASGVRLRQTCGLPEWPDAISSASFEHRLRLFLFSAVGRILFYFSTRLVSVLFRGEATPSFAPISTRRSRTFGTHQPALSDLAPPIHAFRTTQSLPSYFVLKHGVGLA